MEKLKVVSREKICKISREHFALIQHQIVRQVFRGHTMKRNHPALQPAVVGIHVLDVESTINPALLTRVNRSMRNAFLLGEVDIDSRAVGTKNRVRVNQRAQPLPDM